MGVASRRRPRSRSDCVPLARHADHNVRAAAKDGMGEPSRPKICGASSPKRASIARQAAASFADSAAIAARGLLEILADAKIGVVAKDAGETIGGGREGEALRRQLVFVGGEEWRACEQREVHRAEVVAEAGQGDFARLDRAARLARLLDHRDRPAAAQEVDRGGEAVMSRADDDGVESVHAALRSPRLDASCIYRQGRRREGYGQCLPRAMLELRRNRLTRPSRARSRRLLASAYSWAMVGPHSRATRSTEAGCARKLSRSDGDEHEHGPFGLRRGPAVGVDQGRRPDRSARARHAGALSAAADRQEHAGGEGARDLAL